MKKFLIVGAGLSGSLIAYRLLLRGVRVDLIDDGRNVSSVVAAGQINPVTFRRMNLGWRTNACFEELEKLYPELEDKCQTSFFDQLTIRRFFAHQQEVDLWEEKSQEAEYKKHLAPTTKEDNNYPSVHNTFGTGRIISGAVIRPKIFLPAIHNFLKQQENLQFTSAQFDYEAFDVEKRTYQNTTYDYILFAQGFRNFENPFFKHLPVQCTKGQVLNLSIPDLAKHEALNRKCFLIPNREDDWLAGSTYEWNQPNTDTSPEARDKIVENLDQLTEAKFEITDQRAGVRPTSPDRRPIIDEHPDHAGLYIFNGLGTKGYSLAPLLTKEFISHLLDGQAMPEEVSVRRFKVKKAT